MLESKDIKWSNRDEASFALSHPSEEEDGEQHNGEQHNYSTTGHWRERLAKFEAWFHDWESKASADNFDTLKKTGEFPDGEAMYLTEDESDHFSPLSKLLSRLSEKIKKLIAKVQTHHGLAGKENAPSSSTNIHIYQTLQQELRQECFEALLYKSDLTL